MRDGHYGDSSKKQKKGSVPAVMSKTDVQVNHVAVQVQVVHLLNSK